MTVCRVCKEETTAGLTFCPEHWPYLNAEEVTALHIRLRRAEGFAYNWKITAKFYRDKVEMLRSFRDFWRAGYYRAWGMDPEEGLTLGFWARIRHFLHSLVSGCPAESRMDRLLARLSEIPEGKEVDEDRLYAILKEED